VKVAPDLEAVQISALAREIRLLQVDGVIATNTSSDLSGLGHAARQGGGLSGAPLHHRSVSVISQLRAELGQDFPIIGVGGIVSAENARDTLSAGANLVQIYTGFAYRGAGLVEEIIRGLPV
jgi:dihydroorotate dehydrogenase